jgi:uncharacterized membrane protein
VLGEFGRPFVAAGVAAVVQIAVQWSVPYGSDLWVSLLVYWDVMAAVYVALSWVLFTRRSAAQVEAWALARQRPVQGVLRRLFLGRRATSALWFVVYGSVLGLAAAGYVLPRAAELEPQATGTLTVLGLVAIVVSWLAAHTGYVMHYASLYYGSGRQGLEFPGDEAPNLLDFAYFSYGVGKTFGATDVDVTTRRMRRAVLLHGLFSFVFNTAILAVALAYVTAP